MKEKVLVVKVGGKIVETPEMLSSLLTAFTNEPGLKILIHGGGRSATHIASLLGIETQMIGGRRITDAEMLRVVTMVYGGLVNKGLVASLQASGVNALGLTGADLSLIQSHRRPPVSGVDYGFVGDVERVNVEALSQLLHADIVPIIAPLTYEKSGVLLNTNADTIAAEVAKALATVYDVTLTFCFEYAGVLSNAEDEESVIPHITTATCKRLRGEGIITGGMLPKIENALEAVGAGVKRVVITRYDALSEGCGTSIER